MTQHMPYGRPASSGCGAVVAFFVTLGAIVFAVAHFGLIHLSSGNAAQASAGRHGAAATSILKIAESHAGEAYVWGGGHTPSSWQSGDGVDCSGLVIVSTWEATHGKVSLAGEVVSSFPQDGHWRIIPVSQAQPGDILLHLTGSNYHDHVAFVVKNLGNGYFDLFAAWTNGIPLAQQVAFQNGQAGSWYAEAAQFIG